MRMDWFFYKNAIHSNAIWMNVINVVKVLSNQAVLASGHSLKSEKKNPFIFITFYLHADIGSHISSIDEGELWKMSKNLIVGSKTGDQKKRLLLLLPMLFIRNFRYFPKESPVGSPTGLWMFNLFTSCGLWWHLVYTHYTLKRTLLHRPNKTMNEPIFSPIMINYASNTHKYI